MKKVIALLLAAVMLLSLAACGKSEAVTAAETAIEEIGEVTAASKEKIETAEKLYELLTDKEKEQVKNRVALVDARDAYNQKMVEVSHTNAVEIYNCLNDAADICSDGVETISAAWSYGIQNSGKTVASLQFGVAVGILSDDIEQAGADIGYAFNSSWMLSNFDFSKSVAIVIQAMRNKGKYDDFDEKMQKAQSLLQELSSCGDSKYYPKLKEYYAAVDAYGSFFKSPSGSYTQLSATVQGYRSDIDTIKGEVKLLI